MDSRMPHTRLLLALAAPFLMTIAHAHKDPSPAMADAAAKFLGALDASQLEQASLPFTDAERQNWNFVPMVRAGVPLKSLPAAGRELAHELLETALSSRGHLTVEAIIALENVLFEIEKNHRRDPEMYYVAIFGTPGVAPWGWRFEGHHVSLNYTVGSEGTTLSATPSFLGANPAEVRIAPWKGNRALAAEEDLGRRFVNSLTAEQLKIALISVRAPADIVTGNDRKADPGPVVGVKFGDMLLGQRTDLLELLQYYLHRHRPAIAEAAFSRIQAAGIDNVAFAWAGSRTPGEGHYYRIHGPTFIIEYDNTQNNANHVHTVWRDFEGDFGRDVLREHLVRDHGVRKE